MKKPKFKVGDVVYRMHSTGWIDQELRAVKIIQVLKCAKYEAAVQTRVFDEMELYATEEEAREANN